MKEQFCNLSIVDKICFLLHRVFRFTIEYKYVAERKKKPHVINTAV